MAEALIGAANSGNFRIVQQLVQAKASLKHSDWQGKTALHYATLKKHQAIAAYLMRQPQGPDLPDGYYCSITCQLMYDSVIAADKHSYEREAITAWLAHHTTSPKTREVLAHAHLIENMALRGIIGEALDKYPELRHSPDYYIPLSVKQQFIQAVKNQDVNTVTHLLSISRQLLHTNLTAVARETQPTTTTGDKQQDLADDNMLSSINTETSPLYLLPLVCEFGNLAMLKLVLSEYGAALTAFAREADTLMVLIAQHQPDNLLVLGDAFKFAQADYLRLMQATPEYTKHWLKGYLQKTAKAEQPAALQALAIRGI